MTSIWRNCLRGLLGATAVVALAGMARAENEAQPGAGLNPEQLKKQLLEKFDADGDGTLTGAELQNAREAALKQFGAGAGAAGFNFDEFKKRFDGDGDGKLNPQEQAAAMAAFQKARGGGGPATGGLPAGGNGGIPAGGGFGAPANGAGEGNKSRSRDARLKRFDRNSDGKLSDDEKAEAQKELKAKKGERPAGKLTEAMKKFDADDDGKLSDEEKAAAKKDLALKRKGKGKKPE